MLYVNHGNYRRTDMTEKDSSAPEQQMKCKICGNEKGNEPFIARERRFATGEEFIYFICSRCHCIQIKEIPENMDKYYPEEYYSFQQPVFPSKLNWFNAFLKKSLIRYYMGYFNITGFVLSLFFENPFPWIRKREINFDSSILDIGSGSGRKLLSLYRSGFRNLVGIDPYIENDINYPEGVIIKKMEVSEINGKYDFIMLHHSFEHMPDPYFILYHINRLLKPEGCVLIRIPVADSFAWHKYRDYWAGLEAPRHLFLYTPQSMEILAEKSGFIIDSVVYDSTHLQFTDSEKYLRNLPMETSDNIFTKKEIKKFDKEAKRLNKINQGDWACFYLKKKKQGLI